MKVIFSIFLILGLTMNFYGQTIGRSYILSREYLNDSASQSLCQIQYIDGLGRPNQLVQVNITPQHKDLITLQEYDVFGRKSSAWLPTLSTSTNGGYVNMTTLKNKALEFYDDNCPYTKLIYEVSPVERVEESYNPGQKWHINEKANRQKLLINNERDSILNCIYYYAVPTTSGSTNLVRSGNYSTGTLFVTRTEDEDGHLSFEFKDKQEKTVLIRQIAGGKTHDTYYVYDYLNNLCFVLPPMYQDNPSLSLYAYQYKYDNQKRCIEKILPGCGAIKYVYDKADNMVFSQDGVQRMKGEWTFYLYDVFHRPVMQGTCTNTNTASAKEQLVKVQLARNASTRMILASGIENTGYSSSFGLTSPTLHKVNYYDDYTFLNIVGFSNKVGSNVNAKGLLTGNITYLLNGGADYCTVTHYDTKGRVVKVQSDNDISGMDVTTTTYTFTGKPLEVQHVHTGRILITSVTHTETYRYTYDHAERLLKTTHQLDSNPVVILSENTYDNLGRLQTKQLHGNSNLKSTYDYNIRSWMTGISSNPFKENLYYNTDVITSSACYNGNISRMEWQLGSDALQSYNFTYDHLNRLLSANYFKSDFSIGAKTGNYSEKVLRYDKQGNIQALQRSGITNPKGFPSVDPLTKDLIDNLVMTYSGNQLMSVRDAGYEPLEKGTFNYTDTHGGNDFAYDENGNLTKDLDKEITSISYNCLNLPQNITFADNGDVRGISFSYDGNGTKRSVTHVTGPAFTLQPMTSLPGSGSVIGGRVKRYLTSTLYCGNVIYSSTTTDDGFTMTLPKTSLERILTEEGYITYNGTTPEYHYYLKDHLGNVRVVMNQNGSTVEQSSNYYPFGGIFDSTGDGKQPYKFGGKEFDPMHGLNWCDFGNRQLRNDVPGWMSIDPLCEKYYSISPYVYCLNNPIIFSDPNGMSPIYGINGNFLGTDEQGLTGAALVINEKYFVQGMAQSDVQKVLFTGEMTKEARAKMDEHVVGIPERPDYDGFVTISEGIAWAKAHPGALENPTPDNTLYLDASKVNFGNLSVKNIGLNEGEKGNVNLFNFVNLGNAESRASTYALGNTQIQLLDSSKGAVKLFTDGYDWDYHNPFVNGQPQGIRDKLIYWERKRAGVGNIHGFPLVMYGIGKIKIK